MLFSNWADLGRVVVIGPLAYLALVVLLRASGKRTLTKLNVFDFPVTIALGSTLASVILTKSVSLAQGVAGFCVLIFLQYAITWLSVRWPAFENLVKAEPTLLLHDGRYLDGALKAQRVTRTEVQAALRARQGRGGGRDGRGAGDRRLPDRHFRRPGRHGHAGTPRRSRGMSGPAMTRPVRAAMR